VLDHYARTAQRRLGDKRLQSFDLSPVERADLIAFLNTLTDPALAQAQVATISPAGR
jgi:hypothetical protein